MVQETEIRAWVFIVSLCNKTRLVFWARSVPGCLKLALNAIISAVIVTSSRMFLFGSTRVHCKNCDCGIHSVIYLGGLQPFFPVTKGVEKILVTMF